MLTKEEVQGNRERIRNQMRVCLVTPKVQGTPSELEEPGSPLETRLNKRTTRLRKRSYDLSFFKKVEKVKEIYICYDFFALFSVEEKLGEGAQSVVKRCTELASGKVFAVKLFRKCDTELIEMLKTQYNILKSLSHTNIIEGYYLFVNEITMGCQLVLYYCNYPTLHHILVNETLTAQEAANILNKLLAAVTYLHKHGICHRDIKPHNILYDKATGNLKLIDFEISKINRTKFERSEMWTDTGSLFYKAPEMFSSGYNYLVDIWAVGIVAYELFTRKLPFYNEQKATVINLIKTSEPEYPENIPIVAVYFIRKCLEKNPLKRANANELTQLELLGHTETEPMSPTSWYNKSCEAKSRKDSEDTAEHFSLKCFPVTYEEETNDAAEEICKVRGDYMEYY